MVLWHDLQNTLQSSRKDVHPYYNYKVEHILLSSVYSVISLNIFITMKTASLAKSWQWN